MDSQSLDALSANAGGVAGVQLLKQAQQIAASQANQLVESLPEAPSTSNGISGANLDTYA